ncbi:MAG: PAS domain-containing protein [Kiloniellaceae bacterium]
MPSEGCIAELTVYSFRDDGFMDADGRTPSGWPAVLEQLYAYWSSRRRNRPFPARADIDPIDIPTLLEHLLLVDVLRDPLDFRYRLVGGHIVNHAWRNARGQTIRELMDQGDSLERVLQQKVMLAGEAVAESLAPVCLELSYRAAASTGSRRLQGILLPLGQPTEGVNMLLGGISFLE